MKIISKMLRSSQENINDMEVRDMMKIIDNLDKDFFVCYSKKINQHRSALLMKYPCSFVSRHVVPSIISERDSCAFCLGVALCRKIYPEGKISEGLSSHQPLISIVVHLSQYDIHVLLTYMLKWYKTIGLIDSLARWFFVLLICLKEPVPVYTGEFLNLLIVEFTIDQKLKTGLELVRLCYLQKCINSIFNLKRHKDINKLKQYFNIAEKQRKH